MSLARILSTKLFLSSFGRPSYGRPDGSAPAVRQKENNQLGEEVCGQHECVATTVENYFGHQNGKHNNSWETLTSKFRTINLPHCDLMCYLHSLNYLLVQRIHIRKTHVAEEGEYTWSLNSLRKGRLQREAIWRWV